MYPSYIETESRHPKDSEIQPQKKKGVTQILLALCATATATTTTTTAVAAMTMSAGCRLTILLKSFAGSWSLQAVCVVLVASGKGVVDAAEKPSKASHSTFLYIDIGREVSSCRVVTLLSSHKLVCPLPGVCILDKHAFEHGPWIRTSLRNIPNILLKTSLSS